MTNHPNRKRRDVTAEDERQLEAIEGIVADLTPGDTVVELGGGDQDLRPAAPGDIPPQGSAEMPAHNGNGVPPGLRPNAAKLIGQTVAAGLIEALPQVLTQALASVSQRYYCATCLVERLNWEIKHEAELKEAIGEMNLAAMAIAPGPQGDQQRAQLNPFMFLPGHLLPSPDPADPHPEAITEPQMGVVTVSGTTYCTIHVPGVNRPGTSPKPLLLVATATMNPAMLGQFGG